MILVQKFQRNLRNSKRFKSRIKSQNVTASEKWLGYLIGPFGAVLLNGILGTYLNLYYTDVLKLTDPEVYAYGAIFLTLFPLISKLFDGITSVFFGYLIDRTKTSEGKARPWIFVSAPFLTVSGILLFTVPQSSIEIQLVWIVVSYNLFFGVAAAMYNTAHSLMVPLSTRNTSQRSVLSIVTNITSIMVTGIFVAVLFPAVIMPQIGADQSKWLLVISILSILALPLVFIEYYFTKERITEEVMLVNTPGKLSVKQQLKAVITNKYWVLIALFQFLNITGMYFKNTSLIYYSNYVLGTYNDGITQTMLAVIGGLPMGLGLFIVWPLCKKYGKRNVTLAGFFLSVIGGVICWMAPTNMGIVLVGQFIKNIGTIPSVYVFGALFADALDHVEWKSKIRCDGISSSVIGFMLTASSGLSLGLFNLLLGHSGEYAAPSFDPVTGITIGYTQTETIQNIFTFSFVGVEVIAHLLLIILLFYFNIEKIMPQIHKELRGRQKAACEARGEVWIDPEELARNEQEEMDIQAARIAKEERRNRCEKKGLNFEEEEKKWEENEAARRAKAEAKVRKKNKNQ